MTRRVSMGARLMATIDESLVAQAKGVETY
jgi:hypothetical protein